MSTLQPSTSCRHSLIFYVAGKLSRRPFLTLIWPTHRCSAVSTEDGERRAREIGVLFVETSAKAGYNIKALFRKLATALPGSTSAPPSATPAESNLIDIKLQPVPPKPGEGAVSGGGCAC